MQEEIKKGEELFLNNRVEEAEALFLELLEKAPANTEIINNLGVLCHSSDRASEAEAYFKRAIENDSRHPDAPVNLASLYQEQKRWQEAAQTLEQALKRKEDPELYNQLGVVALEMGDTALARKALGRSLEILPDQGEVRESYEALEKVQEPDRSKTRGSSPFRASFVEIDITPQIPENEKIFLQGMAGPPRHATRVSTRLMMQMLLMEDENFTKTLFVTADIFGFGPEITEQVFNSAAQWGIEPEAVFLNASHTHYGPGTLSNCSKAIGPFYKNYADQITKSIISNIAYLYSKLDHAELFYGMTEVMIGVNRRYNSEDKIMFAPNKAGYYQKNTPFILIKTRNKKYILVNHGCHPTGLGNHSEISADYISYMRQDLVTSGTVSGVMFMQGAAGSAKEAHETENGMEFSSSAEDSKTNGLKMASALKKQLKNKLQPLDGTFFFKNRQAILPLREAPSESVLKTIADDENADPLARYWAHGVLERFGNSSLPQQIEFNVQFMGIGERFALLSLPGEPVAELARSIFSLPGWPEARFFLGYTNGLVGYLPTDKILEEGGYEAEMSHLVYLLPAPLAPKTETNIISSVADCLTAFKNNNLPNGYGRYHLARPKKRSAFFVMSAGRCGTMTLAHLLNTATNAKVWHHPQPDLIMEALLAHRGQIDKKQAFWRARYPIIHKTWAEGLIHGETDHLMTPFCDMIAEEIPESKFIVLVRDPRDFVRSGMRRNYYNGHPWDSGRLRPEPAHPGYDHWQSLSQFEKVCWLWNETYTKIQQYLEDIPEDRYHIVRFEDMIQNPEVSKELFDFLGLTGFYEEKIQSILETPLNKQTGGDFLKPEEWGHINHCILMRICRTSVEKFGYEQRFATRSEHPEVDFETQGIPNEGAFPQQSKVINLAFFSLPGLESRLSDIIDGLPKNYQVRKCCTTDQHNIRDAVNWADIVWLEWGNELAIHVTNNVPEIADAKVICRVHSYEVLSGYIQKINWKNIDRVVFVEQHLKNIAEEIHPYILEATSSVVIQNGIDLDKFSFRENGPGYNLGVIARINHKKNPAMLIDLLNRLVQINPLYTLKIAGNIQELRYKYYFRDILEKNGLHKNILLSGWVDDINTWLETEGINYLLSTSVFESFGSGIGEAMAKGIKPVIYSFPYAENIWPEQCLYTDTEDAIGLIREKKYDSSEYNHFVADRYSMEKMQKRINALLNELTDDRGGVLRGDYRIPGALAEFDRPERNLIVTGVPRSGTSLFSVLLNKLENSVCLNEILYDVESLPKSFAEIRKRLANGKPFPNKYNTSDSSDLLTTDTQGDTVEIRNRIVDSIPDPDVLIGSKVNIPYLNQIQKIIDWGYPIVAIIRDPVYTIASWNSKKSRTIPEANVGDTNLHPRWKNFDFPTTDPLIRQALIWNFYAERIWNLRNELTIIRYEDLTENTEETFSQLRKKFDIGHLPEDLSLQNKNLDPRYENIRNIADIVRQHCPIATHFGYTGSINQIKSQNGYMGTGKLCLPSASDYGCLEKPTTPSVANVEYNPQKYWEVRGQKYAVDKTKYSSGSEIDQLASMILGYGLQHSGILEIGSGYGRVYERIKSCLNNFTMCDFVDSMRKKCQERTGKLPDYWDGKKLPYADGEFDMIILFSVLLHVPTDSVLDFLMEATRVTSRFLYIATYTGPSHGLAKHVYRHNHRKLFNQCNLQVVEAKKYYQGNRTNWLLEKKKPILSGTHSNSNKPSRPEEAEKLAGPQDFAQVMDRKGKKYIGQSFDDLRYYCMFVGYPRSGHSLIGSLLDAHPQIVMAHEFHALKHVQNGISRHALFSSLIENAENFSLAGREWTTYQYGVSGQWQGKYETLSVIGDKKGGGSTLLLSSYPHLLNQLRQVVCVPIKFMHIVRNPFDNITTIAQKRFQGNLSPAIEFYFLLVRTNDMILTSLREADVLSIHLESFISNPVNSLREICSFFELSITDQYLEDCSSVVFENPHQTRTRLKWSSYQKNRTLQLIKSFQFLQDYSFES